MAKRAPTAPAWSPADYTPYFVITKPRHTDKELRAEYTRMRDIAHKRSIRLEKAGYTEEAAYIRARMPKIKEMKGGMEELKQRMANNAYSIVFGSQSLELSMKGIKTLERTLVRGLFEGELETDEVLDFHHYMQSWRTSVFSVSVTSDKAQQLYSTDYQDYGGSFDNFYRLYRIARGE